MTTGFKQDIEVGANRVPASGLSASALAAQRATNIAAFLNGPLIPAPAWAAATAYVRGRSVTLPTGQVITCTTSGTSGATAPVPSQAAPFGRPIVDNTATWYGTYESNTVDLPFVAPTISAAASAAAAGLTEIQITANGVLNPNVALLGATPYAGNVGATGLQGVTVAIGTLAQGAVGNATNQAASLGLDQSLAYSTPGLEAEFYVTDSAFGITNTLFASALAVEIDGYLVQADQAMPTGSGACTVYDFNGVVKRRKVRVTYSFNSFFRGIALTPIGFLEPSDSISDGLLVLGDSIPQTISAPGNNKPITLLYSLLRRQLGMTTLIDGAIGGSVYTAEINTVFNTRQAIENKVNRALWTAQSPNHVLILTGYNDFSSIALGNITIDQIAPAALKAWAAARALFPNAKITISDGFPEMRGPDALTLQIAANLLAMFNQWGDQNSRFIQSIGPSASTAWTQGTSSATAALPSTPGNTCVMIGSDNTHPTPWGAYYLSIRLKNAITQAWGGNY